MLQDRASRANKFPNEPSLWDEQASTVTDSPSCITNDYTSRVNVRTLLSHDAGSGVVVVSAYTIRRNVCSVGVLFSDRMCPSQAQQLALSMIPKQRNGAYNPCAWHPYSRPMVGTTGYYRWVGAALFAASLYDRQARVHEELVRFPLTSRRTGLHLREDHVTPLSCSEDVLWRYAEKDMLALG